MTGPQVPLISAGLASEAAQYLRKTHRPVYHRIIEGKEFRGQYVVGTQLLSAHEVVVLAAEKGFPTSDRFLDLVSESPGEDVGAAEGGTHSIMASEAVADG